MTKRFDDVVAVDNMNLIVEEGEFITLLGPSGCGKTTTLRSIAGFIQPEEGEIYFDDELINNVPPNKRFTAMCFQSYALFPHMTVRDNIRFGLMMQKIPNDEQNRRIQEVVAIVGLKGLEDRKPGQLSGGQQQRVALARAVVTHPRILLFDEPLSNLDAKLREYVRVEIRALQKRLKITSIYVTHDQAEALVISDRIVVMNQGRIEQIADPFTIYRYPKNEFVANFIGLANIFEGSVVSRDEEMVTLDTEFGQFMLRTQQELEDERILVSWRPEDMVLAKDGMKNIVQGKIAQAIFMGNLTDLFLEVKDKMIRAQMDSDVPYREGESLTLSIPEEKFIILT
jgi:ABC-type Fe3+/spermidine/putrescine transport system ATPase subunit